MALNSSIIGYRQANFVPGERLQKFVSLSNGVNEVISATANKQIQILLIAISGDKPGGYTLRSGTDDIFLFVLGSFGGVMRQSADEERPIFAGSVGQNVNINVAPSPSNAGVYVQYRYRERKI